MGNARRNIYNIKQLKRTTPEYDVIIPAAGMGHRMKYYGPKSLTELNHNTTILQHQLKIINSIYRDTRIILVVGYQADKIIKKVPQYITVIENENFVNTNVTRSIGMGLNASTKDGVVIIYGDLVFNRYALGFEIGDKSTIVIDKYKTMSDNEVGCVVNSNNIIEQLWYDLPDKWAQIVYLTGKELQLAKQLCNNPTNYNIYGFEMLNKIIGNGGEFKAFQPYKIKVNDIDCLKDLTIAKGIL